MKNSPTQLLFNFVVIAFMTSSCTMYRYDRKFGEYLSNSQAKELVNNLEVNDEVAAKPKEGKTIRGEVLEINDSSFVVRIGEILIKRKLQFDETNDHEEMLISEGIQPGSKVILKHVNGKTVRGELVEYNKDEMMVASYTSSQRKLVSYQYSYDQIIELVYKEKEPITQSINYQDLASMRYDVNVPLSIVGSTIGVVGSFIGVVGILFNLTYEDHH